MSTPEEKALADRERVLAESRRIANESRAAAERASETLRNARTAFDVASAAHASAPDVDAKLMKAWAESDLAVRSAEKRDEAARERAVKADEQVTLAEVGVREAELDVHKAALRTAAAPTTLHQVADPSWQRFFDTGDVRALDEVASALTKATEAAHQLSALAETTQPVSAFHAILPALERGVAEGKALPMHLHNELAPYPSAKGLQDVRDRLVERPEAHVRGLGDRCRAMREGARTLLDIEVAAAKMARAREAELAASRPEPKAKLSPPSVSGRMSFNPPRNDR